MSKIIYLMLIAICIVIIENCLCQTQFQRAIGGTNYDNVYSIIQTTDKGYVAAGYTGSFGAGNRNMYVIKLNEGGMLQWSRTVGGTNVEVALSIIQTRDSGFAAAGICLSFGAGDRDIFFVKLDSIGMYQWSKTIGGTNYDRANSILQTTDGSYIIAGYTDSFGAGNYDMFIVKLDGSGSLQWSRTVGGINDDFAYSIIQTADGGFAMAGSTQSFGQGNFDMYVVKFDTSGTLQWCKTIGGTNDDRAFSIIQTSDGGFVLAGYTLSFGAGLIDTYIVKLNGSGTLLWSRTVGGTQSENGRSIIQTPDGGYAVAGGTFSFGAGLTDMFIVKLDTGGSFQWSKAIGGTNYDEASCIIQTAEGGYAAAGYTFSFGAGIEDMYIAKLDAFGNTCGNSTSSSCLSVSGGTLGTSNPTLNSPNSKIISPTPAIDTGGTFTTVCVIGIQPVSSDFQNEFSLSQNYPNPFNPKSKIKFEIPARSAGGSKLSEAKLVIFDILGREVATLVKEQLQPGTYEVEWDATNYPSGVYYYRLISGEFVETKKMVLIK